MLFPFLLFLAGRPAAAAYTWPNPQIDELEKLLYESRGNGLNTPAFGVLDCATLPSDMPQNGRTNSAEWIRNAYHDMASANVVTGEGGVDGSIFFELDRDENKGLAFLETANFFIPFMSVRSSIADVSAVGAILALGCCSNGGIIVPFRGGRIDATGPGLPGVPEPQQDIETHIKTFENQGFNKSEMAALVACGHSLGGVHGNDFPEIVDVTKDPTEDDNRQDFDSTVAVFDNNVAKQFVNNETQNPLAFGHNETTNSDFRIFNADGGDMIGRMAKDNAFFLATCTSLMARMLDTVPKGVQLTDPIEPIFVKPLLTQVLVNPDATMTIYVKLRVMNDGPSPRARKVYVDVKPRDPSAAVYTQKAEVWSGSNLFEGAYPPMPDFMGFSFKATVPVSQGVSSFTVRIQDQGKEVLYDNGGQGFPFQDIVQPQVERSCLDIQVRGDRIRTMNLTVAVRDDVAPSNVILSVPWPQMQNGSIVPRFETTNLTMQKTQSLDKTGYSLYNAVVSRPGSDTISIIKMLTYDVIVESAKGIFRSDFNNWNDFMGGDRCTNPS